MSGKATQFQVTGGGSVCVGSGLLKPGTIFAFGEPVEDDLGNMQPPLTQAQIKTLMIPDGDKDIPWLSVYERGDDIWKPDDIVEDAPGQNTPPDMRFAKKDSAMEVKDIPVIKDSINVVAREQRAKQARRKWNPEEEAAQTEDLEKTVTVEDTGSKIKTTSKTQPKKKRKNVRQLQSKWIYNPEDLKEYDLERLNEIAISTDEELEPFDNTEEAVAWLSQDFTPATTVTISRKKKTKSREKQKGK